MLPDEVAVRIALASDRSSGASRITIKSYWPVTM